jgi:hypothetical protein
MHLVRISVAAAGAVVPLMAIHIGWAQEAALVVVLAA